MRRHGWAFLLLAPLCMVAVTDAVAERVDDATNCFSRNSFDYKRQEFIDTGIRACTRLIAIRNGAGLAAAYGARAYWYTKQRRFEDALADFDRAIEINPKNVELYDYRADVWLLMGNVGQALASYEMSIRVDPTYAPAYYGRGQAYEKLGQVERAIESYRATIAAPEKDRIGAWAQRQARARLEALAKAN